MSTEIWKRAIIEGADSEIWVSSFGRAKTVSYMGNNRWHEGTLIRKTRNPESNILSPSDNGNGYKYISASVNGKRKHLYMHRLVAEAFIPKVKGKDFVNHIDYDRGNNRVDNLEWCTQTENMRHSAHRMQHPRPAVKAGEYGRGIRKRLKTGRFEVTVCYRGKGIYCGTYGTAEEAREARNAKYEELGIPRIYYSI